MGVSTDRPERLKPGRKPKGPRTAMLARVPVEHRELYERMAAAEGLSLGDFVAQTLARACGLPDPDYIERYRKRPEQQEALPLASGQ